jgi:hypothetical protein
VVAIAATACVFHVEAIAAFGTSNAGAPARTPSNSSG